MSWGEVKYSINSTLGTEDFMPLNILLYRSLSGINEESIFQVGTHKSSIPYYIKGFWLTACGGGGGGYAQGDNYNASGGGGGGAAVVNQYFSVLPNEWGKSYNITVGAGGLGRVPGDTGHAATDGGTTIVGEYITLLGGKPSNGFDGGDGGGAGGGNGGRTSINGENGILGSGGISKALTSQQRNSSGGGGGGSLGNGGDGGYFYGDRNGKDGIEGGGGGGSAGGNSSYGGNGGDGIVKIRWDWIQ